jgi:CubicO group peptidase (beta-lactamase class C family)
VHRGYLVYERYFGRGNREAAPNGASLGKSFTSVAAGILVYERKDLFPRGLDEFLMTPKHFPAEMFPLSDPRKSQIRLGHLLAMTAGIRGNNPGIVRGKPVTLQPAGPDGWLAMTDNMAFGRMTGDLNAISLWCEPGEGYSYATSSIHLVSAMIRHITGGELEAFVRERIGNPLGWERWGWGYKNRIRDHTPGGGGIALRPTDMLRFGYLLLHDGKWRDRQVVPSDYVRQARRPSRFNPHFDYSLQFDVNGNGRWPGVPRDAFWKTGSGGHCLYVVPSMDLVVYKLGGRTAQYSEEDTGLKQPPYDGSREDWQAPSQADPDPNLQTIKLVLEALNR